MIILFLRYHLSAVIKYFRTKRIAKSVTIGAFLVVLFFVFQALFVFFKWSTVFITKDPYLKVAMPLFVYEIFFLILFFIIIVSGLINFLLGLFRREIDEWILASPKFKSVSFYTFLRVFIGSMIPLLIVALPAVLGIRSALSFSNLQTIIALLSLTLIVLFSVFVVFLFLMFFARLLVWIYSFFKKTKLSFTSLIIWSCVILICIFSFYAWRIVSTDIVSFFGEKGQNTGLAGIDVIVNTFSSLPSHLSAWVLFSLQNGNTSAAVEIVFLQLILCIFAFVISIFLSRWHLELWKSFQDGKRDGGTKRISFKNKNIHFPKYFKGPLGTLFEKEALMLFRDAKNTLWLFFLLLIWGMQTGLNFFLRKNISKHSVDVGTTPEFLLVLQLVVIVYFISAFVLRFAFPSFSMERKMIWILGSVPIDEQKLFWSKFVFYACVFLIMGLGIAFLNSFLLGVAALQTWLFLIFVCVAIMFVTALGLGLGAMFPNFETDDPQTLSTTLPGISFIFGSLVYGGIGAFIMYKFLVSGNNIPLFAFELLSFLFICILLYISPKPLRNIDFLNTRIK